MKQSGKWPAEGAVGIRAKAAGKTATSGYASVIGDMLVSRKGHGIKYRESRWHRELTLVLDFVELRTGFLFYIKPFPHKHNM